MAAGDFTASTLSTVIETEDAIFGDARQKRLYMPKSVALQEIVKEQTARLDSVTASAINKIKVAFVNTNGITANDCPAPSCTPTGALLATDGVEYTLDQCTAADNFKVEVVVGANPYSAYANGIIGYAQLVATGMLRQKKEIEEKMAAKSVSLTVGKAGVNADTYGENGSVVTGTNTTIPAAYWTANLFPFFQQEAELNRFANPYMIHGRNLNLYRLEAIPNAQNNNQRSQLADFELIESAWDPFTFGKLSLDRVSLMIDAGAIAFANRNVYGRTVEEPMANTRAFSVPSISFPGVVDFDVEVTRVCEVVAVGTAMVKKWFDVFSMKAPFYNIIANPANGLAGDTGVLKFTNI